MALTLPRFVRDPLVHFVVLGAALFVAERVTRRGAPVPAPAAPSAKEADTRISMSDETRRLLVEEHARSYGRPPSEAEMKDIVSRWVDEELLYREAKARELDKDDPRIRHLVAQKMSFVLEQGLVLSPPTDAELKVWFDGHADRWARPALIDFTQVFVDGNDAKADERARGFLARLESGVDPAGMGDVFSGGRRYRRRSLADLAESFGTDFVAGLGEQKENTWALRRSRFGLHVVRVDKRSAAEKPSFEEVRADVQEDFEQARRKEKLAEAVGELRKRWTIEARP